MMLYNGTLSNLANLDQDASMGEQTGLSVLVSNQRTAERVRSCAALFMGH